MRSINAPFRPSGTSAAESNHIPVQASGSLILVPLSKLLKGNSPMAAGAGITTGTGTIYKASVSQTGGLIKTEIFIDLTGLSSNILADIIGVSAAANCHLGQITTAINGTPIAGRMTCLETPTGGEPDIDLYSAVESTGTEDAAITALTETALLTAGADWTTAAAVCTRPLTALPAADEYLYLAGGGGTTDAVYTAGKFLIEMWGQ